MNLHLIPQMVPLGQPRLVLFALPILLLVALGQAVLTTLRRRDYPWREALGTLEVVVGQIVIRPLARLLVVGTWMMIWPWRMATVPLTQTAGWVALFLAV